MTKSKFSRIAKKTILFTAVAGTLYLTGYNHGFKEGAITDRNELVMGLAMDRHDFQQDAKYANSAREQHEILEDAGAINRVFEILYNRGEMDEVSGPLLEEAIGAHKYFQQNN